MKHFRRSTKSSESGSHRSHHISIPQKDAIAIVPPKKVIKALYDYTPDSDDQSYLAFSQGDFLHVVGREDDTDWYEACNPIVRTRGLVPVNYFDLIPQQIRSSELGPVKNPGTPNGFALPDRTVNGNRIQSMSAHDSGYGEKSVGRTSTANSTTTTNGRSGQGVRMSALGRQSGAMVYGIVQYDFKAERPDELQASAGEAIIVIAQSNPEWFVAKPITRLGGPGLIPVSFIEIRDMTTGVAVPDAQDAVTRAGVPKVEDWKRMAASYKNSSIPLGKLGNSNENSERVSVDSNGRGSYDALGGYGQQVPASQQVQQNGQRFSQMVVPLRARVPRYCHHEMKFWFVVEAFMEDGKYWELNREYTDFYGLQTALMEEFPEVSGKVQGHKRTLPFMPGPLPWVTERLTSERREHMDKYLTQLLNMSSNITTSYTVRDFFAPREGDIETEPSGDTDSEWVRLSQGSSQQSYAENSRQSSTGNLSNTGQTAFTSPQKKQQQVQQGPYDSVKQPPGHYRTPSDLRAPNGAAMPPPMQTNGNSALSPSPAPNNGGAKIKVKAFLGDQNCVILRMDQGFNYLQLLEKVQERWQIEHPGMGEVDGFYIEAKDESTGNFSGLTGDSDLARAFERSEKLTVRVGADRRV